MDVIFIPLLQMKMFGMRPNQLIYLESEGQT